MSKKPKPKFIIARRFSAHGHVFGSIEYWDGAEWRWHRSEAKEYKYKTIAVIEAKLKRGQVFPANAKINL